MMAPPSRFALANELLRDALDDDDLPAGAATRDPSQIPADLAEAVCYLQFNQMCALLADDGLRETWRTLVRDGGHSPAEVFDTAEALSVDPHPLPGQAASVAATITAVIQTLTNCANLGNNIGEAELQVDRVRRQERLVK